MPGFVMYKSALAHFPYGQSATFHCHHERDYEDCKQILKLAKTDAHIGAPGKTVAIAEGSATSTDFPLRAERYPSGSLCLAHDPAKASLTDVFS